MDEQTLSFIIIGVMLLLILTLFSMIRVIPEYERLVILALGQYRGTRGPGLVIIVPIFERALKVDLRQKTLDVPQQALVTADDEGITHGITVTFRIVEPMMAVLSVENIERALTTASASVMREVIADSTLDDLKFKSESIRLKIQAKLGNITEKWGVRIEAVELRAEDTDKRKREKI